MEARRLDDLEVVQFVAEMYLKSYCRKALDRWSKHLENANIETGFVDLQLRILNHSFHGQVVPIFSYETLFEDKNELRQRQILIISGEAGCGKSTYVQKLALDWAKGNSYLRNKFDLVLLYDSSCWKKAVKQGLGDIFSELELKRYVTDLLEHSNKVLIICDMNTTLPDNEACSLIRSILRKERYPNATIMVTTHDLGFPDICPEFVWIDGFSDKGVLDFMQIQKCQVADVELLTNLQLPLSCAIYCILQKVGYSTSLATDLFDLMKCYVDHTLQKHFETTGTAFTKENVNETLMAIGKYSLIHLVEPPTFDELNDLKSVVSENHFDCESLNGCNLDIGLFTKRKNGNEYEALHQSVANYLAAYYISNVVNLELNFPGKYYPWMKTQLAEFVCYNILLMWEEGKFGDKSVSRFLEEHRLCFLWFCKRPSAFKGQSIHYIDTITALGPPNNWSSSRIVKWLKNLHMCPNLNSFSLFTGILNQVAWKSFVDILNSGCLPQLGGIFLHDDLSIGNEVAVFKAIGNLQIVTTVQLLTCGLTSESVDALVEEMNSGNLSKVERFALSENVEIGKQSSFFSSLIKCPNLFVVDLDSCEVTATSIKFFADGIDGNNFPNIIQISLAHNKQIGSVVEFFSSLEKLPNLKSLILRDCDITLASLQAMANVIKNGKFPNLSYLDVSCNSNVGPDLSFINAILFCEKLRGLEIFMCNMTVEGFESLNTLRGKNCIVNDVKPKSWN